jgi:hypothetical protein
LLGRASAGLRGRRSTSTKDGGPTSVMRYAAHAPTHTTHTPYTIHHAPHTTPHRAITSTPRSTPPPATCKTCTHVGFHGAASLIHDSGSPKLMHPPGAQCQVPASPATVMRVRRCDPHACVCLQPCVFLVFGSHVFPAFFCFARGAVGVRRATRGRLGRYASGAVQCHPNGGQFDFV